MNADWKLTIITTCVLLKCLESRATLNGQQSQGQQLAGQNQYANPQVQNSIHKCVIEVPAISLKAYPHAKVIRMGSSIHLTVIETCCPGYRNHKLKGVASTTTCLPICENCSNGYCLQPGECECFDGFVKNDNGDCVFECPVSCLHGRCYLDGSCRCDQGYKLDETKKFCRPICSEGCNGWRQNCTAPETCGCSKGYTLKEKGCQPVCDPDCGLGGICTEPNVCICRMKYTLKNGVCQASCYQKCDNGICFSANRCLCFAGYKYHEKTTTCVPL